jgi:3-deoxy-D-arabino-heptulosonate 7-phosphate (DAHP) synthase
MSSAEFINFSQTIFIDERGFRIFNGNITFENMDRKIFSLKKYTRLPIIDTGDLTHSETLFNE